MNKNKSNGLSGDLNYLVTSHLLKTISLQPEGTNELLLKIKQNLNFGSIFDFDLNRHPCSYEQRKEIHERVEKTNLDEIYLLSKHSVSSFINNNEKNENEAREEKIISNDGMMDILSEIEGDDKKKQETKKKDFNSFSFLKNVKNFQSLQKNENFIKENLQDAKIRSYKHMKSVLGHISTVDDNIINPVAIYCVTYSNDNDLIFTGDNNGLIKIWSSRTGALVDIFKSHEKAINDTLLIKDYLISCSDDMSIKIWNVKQLNLLKTLNFEESINRVISYEYMNELTEHVHDIVIASSSSGKIFIFDLEKVVDRVNNINRSPNEYENEMIISKIYFDKKIIEKFFLKKVKNNLQQSCMATHKNPGTLICGYNEGLVCVWDIKRILDSVIKNDKFLYDFEKYVLFLEYVHSSLVHIAEFNKTGDYFITGGIDGHVLVWKVQENILKLQRKGQKPEDAYPIFSIFKISENEERIRCSVNSSIWSTQNNYVVTIISSKARKKTVSNNPTVPQNQNLNQTQINHRGINFNEINNNQLNDSHNNDATNRTSSILIYSKFSNSVIRRYDHKNGFTIHDECYVLESHPENEEVILTVSNSNEILIFNFISGNILCKFTEENYFFNNLSQNMIALEGKFSPNGDSFVISTYLGSISIYSIYSKNSFSTTHMNQFFDKEFINETNDQNSASLASESDMPFITYVNMHNLPYIIQQPYSKYKLNQLEKTAFKRLIKNYNFSQKQIENKLMNNYMFYDKNLEERRIECEAEEKIFIQAARENLTYFVPDNIENNSSESEYESENSDYNSNEDITSNIMIANNDDEEDIHSVSKSSMDLDEESHSEENDDGMYNLRSRRRENNNRSNNLRSSRRNNNNITNNNITNRNSNDVTSEYVRSRLRNRRITHNHNYEEDNSDDNRSNNIEVENLDEGNLGQNSRRTRRRLRKINRNHNLNEDETKDIFEEYKDDNSNDDSDKIFSSEKKPKKSKLIHDSNIIHENNDDSDSETYDKEIKQLIINSEQVEAKCFLCKYESKSLIGPFTSENHIDFVAQHQEVNGGISIIDDEDIPIVSENYYFHLDCLISFNDFIVFYNKRRGNTNRVNLSKTISEVIIANKTCWRCNSNYATKKCSNEECDRYFHGYNCLPKYCINLENNLTYCLECYKTKSINYEEKIVNRKNETHTMNNSKIQFNKFSREFFLREKFSFYGYYPQIGDKVYFVIHAYEEFIRGYFDNILSEIDDDEKIFFWKSQEFLNTSRNNFRNNNTVSPFLCEVMHMEFTFPNLKTITLMKRLYKGDWKDKLKILIKLKLKIMSTGNEIKIVFFENEYPDFMINSQLYEKNLEYYNEFKANIENRIHSDLDVYTNENNKNHEIEKLDPIREPKSICENNSDTGLSIVIGDEVYWAKFIRIEGKENNEIYKDSLFENILMQYDNQEDNEDKEFLRISFWDIKLDRLEHPKDQLMKSVMEMLCLKLDEIYNRSTNKYSPFYEMVDEVEDMAIDYYNMIQVPMFLKLIKTRLNNLYYINTQSIEFDLQLIEKNSMLYNSPNALITRYSRQLVTELKSTLNIIINSIRVREMNSNSNHLSMSNDNSANKFNKKSSMLKGIDMPDEAYNITGDNLLNTKRLRRRFENNIGVAYDNKGNTNNTYNYNSSTRLNPKNNCNGTHSYQSDVKISKDKNESEKGQLVRNLEIELNEDRSENYQNIQQDDQDDYDMSEEYSNRRRNRYNTRSNLASKKNENTKNLTEIANYSLRKKRQKISDDNF